MTKYTFHGDDVEPSPPGQALFHVIPVPLEKTVSYGSGTAEGPQAILEASSQLELFDGISNPSAHGIHTTDPVQCGGSVEEAIRLVEKEVSKTLQHKAIPVLLGGEHSLTFGAIQAIKRNQHDFGVVQFDAHADLRDTYEGSGYSHACVMRRIVEEDIPIYQLGTRSYSEEEHLLRQERKIWYRDAETLWQKGTEKLKLPTDCPEKIYITFDVDCFDAAVMPATGTPVPGGLNWYQVIWALKALLEDKVCIGFDLVELAPQKNMHGTSYSVAQLAYNIMGYLVRSGKNRQYYSL